MMMINKIKAFIELPPPQCRKCYQKSNITQRKMLMFFALPFLAAMAKHASASEAMHGLADAFHTFAQHQCTIVLLDLSHDAIKASLCFPCIVSS